jgi:hypothetical protein
MGLVLIKKWKTIVIDLILEHNHTLHTPETFHLMISQRNISPLQAFEIEAANDAGIRPKDAHDPASMQVGGSFTLTYTCRDQKNYLRSKCQSLPDSGALPSVPDTRQSPITLGKGFAECNTRQRALGSNFVGKDVFAECFLLATRQNINRKKSKK